MPATPDTNLRTMAAIIAVRAAFEAINLANLTPENVGQQKRLAFELAARLGELQSAMAADAMERATNA